MKVASLTALGSGRLYQLEDIADNSFLLEAYSTPRLWFNRKELVIQNPIDGIGNRTRDLPACSAVPQPTQS